MNTTPGRILAALFIIALMMIAMGISDLARTGRYQYLQGRLVFDTRTGNTEARRPVYIGPLLEIEELQAAADSLSRGLSRPKPSKPSEPDTTTFIDPKTGLRMRGHIEL